MARSSRCPPKSLPGVLLSQREPVCETLREAGLDHVWLPYAQMKTMRPPLAVARTHGTRIVLADGRELTGLALQRIYLDRVAKLVDSRDPGLYAEALASILDDPLTAAEMSVAAATACTTSGKIAKTLSASVLSASASRAAGRSRHRETEQSHGAKLDQRRDHAYV